MDGVGRLRLSRFRIKDMILYIKIATKNEYRDLKIWTDQKIEYRSPTSLDLRIKVKRECTSTMN